MERKMYDSFCQLLLRKGKMPSMISALLFLRAAVPRNSLLRPVQSSNNIWGSMTYVKKATNGDLGPTAQYWSMYVHVINRVHRDLMRALRTNDVAGYINILPAMIEIVFGLNRPNYAGWVRGFLTS